MDKLRSISKQSRESVELAASFIDFLHYCLPSSVLYDTGKGNRNRRTDSQSERHPVRTIGAPTSIILHILCQMPFMLQPCLFILVWDTTADKIALNNAGLHTQWLGFKALEANYQIVVLCN